MERQREERDREGERQNCILTPSNSRRDREMREIGRGRDKERREIGRGGDRIAF